ncbi:nucleolar transcription factor 1-like isoform X2 [Takifugu flavidus]|uniref:nucleolar transcription factor 1-like isoform X2 n=1 Tax=Takifugu flavidus TaxID=433684 RepID=UPI0025442783|nr:nucleolar transcription factor 1-like isoform X2 [Takifugu flavidus]
MSRHKNEGDWTTQNIQRLLAELKRSVPEKYKTCSYIAGMKSIQWENVAFPPFSAEACQTKWGEILWKIRKIRSLTELINEAEETFTNPINQVHYTKDKPLLQDFNRKTQVCREQHQDSGCRKRMKTNEFCVSIAEDEQPSKDLLSVKPPSTGYNLFCKEQMKHMSGVSKKSISVVLAQRWKALTENEKKEYCARCKEMKREYAFDIGVLTNTPKCEELLPARPPQTGYNLFCKEQVNHITGVPKKMYCTVLAKRWKELTEKQRQEYSVRCRELKRQYQNDLTCCLMMEELEEEKQGLDQHGTKKMNISRNGRAAITGEPPMPSRYSYHIYIKEEMKRLKKNIPDTKIRFAKINQNWKQLSSVQKEAYEKKQEENIAKYSLELQQWFQGLNPQEQKEYRRQNPSKFQYLNYINTAAHKEFPPMPSDSEDEDITDDSSSEDLYFDSIEEDEEDEDMPFMF